MKVYTTNKVDRLLKEKEHLTMYREKKTKEKLSSHLSWKHLAQEMKN